MAFTVGSIAAKDGAAATVGGGLLAADVAGGGVGPWFLYHGLVDGVAGSNKAQVTSANALKTDVSAVPADPFGANADAASATGSVSAKLRAIATALGTTALDLGVGTGGTRTLRVAMDSGQLDPVVAHDAVDSGNPYKQGFKATTSLAGLTLVANADRTDAFSGIDGVQITRPHCNLEDIVTNVVTCTAGANTSGIAAQGAGVKFYLTDVMIVNTGTTGGRLPINDGSGGTTKANVPFPAGAGTVKSFAVPVPFTANTAVFVDPTGSDDIIVTLIGFKSKV